MTRGVTDDSGTLQLQHISPERSYILGKDAEGGVFVSENFFYESEIYTTRLYILLIARYIAQAIVSMLK